MAAGGSAVAAEAGAAELAGAAVEVGEVAAEAAAEAGSARWVAAAG